MNKYRDKSDFEINKAVAEELKLNYEIDYSMRIVVIGEHIIYNPCLNPSQAMPIIIENNISLHAPIFSEGWMAEYTGSDEDVNDGFQVDYFDAHNQNPYRAAMEVFLMMKDAENES
ncbi:TPA: phage protein NinX family protein [Morganella morganii]